jgi:hypothetical protein
MIEYFSDKRKDTHTGDINDHPYPQPKSWLTGPITTSNWPAAIP